MPHPIAYHLLVAEAMAWPIASPSAFAHRTTCMVRPAMGVLDAATQRLADDLEEHLRKRAGGLSLEVLRQLRDRAWFEGTESSVDVIEHLVRAARRFLKRQGGTVVLRPRDPHDPTDTVELCERAGRWRWLSLLMPADLLIAALFAPDHAVPTVDQVTLTTPHLRQTLEGPLPAAETHLHLGAAMSFGLLWTGLVHALATDPLPNLSKLRDLPFDTDAGFLEMALAAAIVRLLLRAFLDWHDRVGGAFKDFANLPLGQIAARLSVAQSGPRLHVQMLRVLQRMVSARAAALPVAGLRQLYRWLARASPLPSNPRIADIIDADPILGRSQRLAAPYPAAVQRSPFVGGIALPETRFAARAIEYLRGAGRRDEDFLKPFLQYLRIRCRIFRYLVEEPGTAGLDWFSRHYYRLPWLRGPVDRVCYESALRTDAANLRLGAIEGRIGPASSCSWMKVRDEVRLFTRQARRYVPPAGQGRPEIGLIVHFIKQREYRDTLQHADPQSPNRARFAQWWRTQHRFALAIEGALRRMPELLAILRGIDIANLELAVPLWPALPLLQNLRLASVDAATTLARTRPDWQVAPLRVTQHAGEDFRRLVEGLRHIHEPVEFGLLTAGDRIGHGVALGTDPADWASHGSIVAQPAEERLDDLLWELERYGNGEMPTDSARLELARSEAMRHAHNIYGQCAGLPPTIDDLLEARRKRHNSDFLLKSLGYPKNVKKPAGGLAELLVWHYLTDPAVFARGQVPVDVPVNAGEVAMLRAAQRWIRQRFGNLEITIETNPSSNQLIGDMAALESHPAFRMRPLPGRAEPEGGSLLISINVDNPITFASCLADEFAHIYYAMLRAGIESQVALEWLECVRTCGWRSRFTLPISADERCLNALEPAGRNGGEPFGLRS